MVSSTYDDAESYLLNFETELPDPDEASATHIGFYLAWALNNGLAAATFDACAASVRQRTLTGCALLWRQCDGKLTTQDLNERGNAFTQAYYAQRYVDDYRQVFAIDTLEDDAFCKVPNTWANYDRIAARLDERHRAWLAQQALPGKQVLMQRLEAAVLPLLEQNGFERYPYEFSQRDYEISVFRQHGAWGDHTIRLRAIDDRPNAYGLHMEGSSRLTVLAQAVYEDAVLDGARVSRELAGTSFFPLECWLGDWPVPLQPLPAQHLSGVIPLTDAVQIEPVIRWLERAMKARLLPLLRAVESLAGYEALYCTTPLSASRLYTHPLHPTLLLCAELTGNPRLLVICDEIDQALGADPQITGWPVHAIEDMRRHVRRVRARAARRRG